MAAAWGSAAPRRHTSEGGGVPPQAEVAARPEAERRGGEGGRRCRAAGAGQGQGPAQEGQGGGRLLRVQVQGPAGQWEGGCGVTTSFSGGGA